MRIVGRRRGQAFAGDPLDLRELAVGLHGQRPAGAREAARRQHVVRARGVVAGGLGRPAADEDRARVADGGDGGLGVVDVDREVLRAVAVDEGDPGGEVRDQHDPAVVGERAGEDVAAGGRREPAADLGLDRVGQALVRS